MNDYSNKHVLIIDDESDLVSALHKTLQKEGLKVFTANDAKAGLGIIEGNNINVVISDLVMPEMDGMTFLKHVKKNHADIEIILLTAYGTLEKAVEAIRQGAYDFIAKPFKRITLLKVIQKALEKQTLEQENRFLREQLKGQQKDRILIGSSYPLRQVLSWIERVAPITSTVLITGESGTGKELVARAIHEKSPRNKGRFVAINCGAIPETLMESELFGHVRGAFTGAIRDKEGFFATASRGTLFLDEIGTIPISLQIKLLRAIEEKEILPVGSTVPIPIDVRIIAASNRDLLTEVEEGRFREDLYYRINVVGIKIPPLRERRDDIPELVKHFIKIHNAELNKNIIEMSKDALHIICKHNWKGNVRELDNVIERAMILCDDEIIHKKHLPEGIGNNSDDLKTDINLKQATQQFEREHISYVLKQFGYNKLDAATALGLSQSSLYRKMAELKIPINPENS